MRSTDLEYVFNRLDKDHISGCAEQAREQWDAGTTVFEVCYQPGDFTHYSLVFSVLRGTPVLGAPGGGTAGHEPSTGTGCWPYDGSSALVTYSQKGRSGFIGRRDFLHPSWVLEYLTDNEASSLALAMLLNEITGHGSTWQATMVENTRELEQSGVS